MPTMIPYLLFNKVTYYYGFLNKELQSKLQISQFQIYFKIKLLNQDQYLMVYMLQLQMEQIHQFITFREIFYFIRINGTIQCKFHYLNKHFILVWSHHIQINSFIYYYKHQIIHNKQQYLKEVCIKYIKHNGLINL